MPDGITNHVFERAAKQIRMDLGMALSVALYRCAQQNAAARSRRFKIGVSHQLFHKFIKPHANRRQAARWRFEPHEVEHLLAQSVEALRFSLDPIQGRVRRLPELLS